MTPNLFTFATSELSQDAFFAWLLRWVNHPHSELYAPAKDLLRILCGEDWSGLENESLHVEIRTQEDDIDIKAIINDHIVLVIEDKVDAGEHGQQLEKYIKLTQERHENAKLLFRYLKTGNSSRARIKQVERSIVGLNHQFNTIERGSVLKVLRMHQNIQNDIYRDYAAHLETIEQESNVYRESLKNLNKRAIQGLFMELEAFVNKMQQEEKLPSGHKDWEYVSNADGGFWSFTYAWQAIPEGVLYVQLEMRESSEPKLYLKVKDPKKNAINTKLLNESLIEIAKNVHLQIDKPASYRKGNYRTFGQIVLPAINSIEELKEILLKTGTLASNLAVLLNH